MIPKKVQVIRGLPRKEPFSTKRFFKVAKLKGLPRKDAKAFLLDMRYKGHIYGPKRGWWEWV